MSKSKSKSYLSEEPFFISVGTSLDWMDEHLTIDELVEVFNNATMSNIDRETLEGIIDNRMGTQRPLCVDCLAYTKQSCFGCGRPWCIDCEENANNDRDSEHSKQEYEELCLTCRAKQCGCHIGEAD